MYVRRGKGGIEKEGLEDTQSGKKRVALHFSDREEWGEKPTSRDRGIWLVIRYRGEKGTFRHLKR